MLVVVAVVCPPISYLTGHLRVIHKAYKIIYKIMSHTIVWVPWHCSINYNWHSRLRCRASMIQGFWISSTGNMGYSWQNLEILSIFMEILRIMVIWIHRRKQALVTPGNLVSETQSKLGTGAIKLFI